MDRAGHAGHAGLRGVRSRSARVPDDAGRVKNLVAEALLRRLVFEE